MYTVGAVAIPILFLSFLTPPWIGICCNLCGKCRCGESHPFAKDDEKENKAIAAKYKTELEKLKNQTPLRQNAVMITELYQIQQQLKDEFDQLLPRRQQRNRKRTETPEFFRAYSFSVYIFFLLGVIYLGAKFSQYPIDGIDGIVIFNLIILVIIILVESRRSCELQYIKNLSTMTLVTESIQSYRNAKPTINMNAQCYHVGLDGDDKGAHIVEPFHFTHWFDSSQSTLTDIHNSRVSRIKIKLSVQFGDEATAQRFAEKFQQFQDENRNRDEKVKFFISNEVDGFKERLTMHDDCLKPPWINSVWFWLATLFGLGWPYRIMFNLATSKTEYSIVKVIFCSAPPPSSNFMSASPEIDNVIDNIQGMLDRLNANALLPVYDGEMPVSYVHVAENEHVDVLSSAFLY